MADERLTVRNTGRFPELWLEVRDNSDLPGHHGGRVISLASKQMRTWRVQTRCQQRGRFTLGPLTITSGDPFGLFNRERTIGGTQSLLVYPATVDLPRFRVPAAELAGESRFYQRTNHLTPNYARWRPKPMVFLLPAPVSGHGMFLIALPRGVRQHQRY